MNTDAHRFGERTLSNSVIRNIFLYFGISLSSPRLRVSALKLFLLCFFLGAFFTEAAEVMPPKPTRYFNDYAKVVSAGIAEQLNRTLEDFEKETSSQIVVAIFPKMQTDSSIEDYANRIFRNWGVGQKTNNNGAILFIFVEDRKMRIETGYGLEGTLPDALAKRIIEDEIKPHFQRNDFDGGLKAGVTAILQATKGEYKGSGKTVAQRNARPKQGIPWLFIIVMLFIVFSMIRPRGRSYSRRGRNSGVFFPFPMGGGGGWGGGSGGGGFSGGGFSGGGGSSGGGGASGSW